MCKISVAFVVCGLLASVKALPAKALSDSPKVVDGVNSTRGEIPYQISLRHHGDHVCGASLVVVNEKQVILTAAHCVDTGSADEYTVVGGALTIPETSDFQQTRHVSKIVIHKSYVAGKNFQNIAILFLKSPFEINDNVAPIPLPTQDQTTTGNVLVSRFVPNSNNDSAVLQTFELPVVDKQACSRAYSVFSPLQTLYHYVLGSYYVKSGELCAGFKCPRGNVSCDVETGGPVRAINGGYLAGIVNWGPGSVYHGFPGVNADVSYFVDWIYRKVNLKYGLPDVYDSYDICEYLPHSDCFHNLFNT